MRTFFTFFLICLYSVVVNAQSPANFNLTDVNGVNWNLYEELGKGKVVILDFFFVVCKPCQRYTPMIQSIYEEYGGDTGNVLVFGISDRDDNISIKKFEDEFGVTYPSCGYEGGGDTITDYFRLNNTFLGWPTYAVVCPDTSMFWSLDKADSFPSIRDSIKQCPEPKLGIPISKVEEFDATIYYDKCTQQLILKHATNEEIIDLTVFNNQGQLIQKLTINPSNRYDVSLVANGIYYVQILTDTKRVVHKFLKLNNY